MAWLLVAVVSSRIFIIGIFPSQEACETQITGSAQCIEGVLKKGFYEWDFSTLTTRQD